MNRKQGTTTLFLIRHGHTVNGDEKRYKGHIDVELSGAGKSQILRLSENLYALNHNLKAIYCSDLKRAGKSAEIISEPLDLKPVVLPELRERSFGRWEGMSFNEIAGEYPEEFERWKSDPLRFSPPGGESTLQVKDRVLKVINRLTERHRGEKFVIVSHGGVNRVVLCHLMGIPLENIFRVDQAYGCLNIIELLEDGFPVIKLLNGG